jgi:hypothetical protein
MNRSIHAKVVRNYIAFSEEKNTPSVRLKLRAVNEEDTKTYWANLYLTDVTTERTIKTLWEVFEFAGSIETIDEDQELFAGRSCVLVGKDDDNGIFHVDFVNREQSTENRRAQVRALAALIDRKIEAFQRHERKGLNK